MYIDGGNAWTVYWRLILPLSRPALATAGIFVFLASWDEFWALTIIKGRVARRGGVRLMSTEMDTQWWKRHGLRHQRLHHEHPWFAESRSGRDSPKRDWYRWRLPHDGTGAATPARIA